MRRCRIFYRESSARSAGLRAGASWETNDAARRGAHHHLQVRVVGDDRGFLVYTPLILIPGQAVVSGALPAARLQR
jgi:hypothetical protein